MEDPGTDSNTTETMEGDYKKTINAGFATEVNVFVVPKKTLLQAKYFGSKFFGVEKGYQVST